MKFPIKLKGFGKSKDDDDSGEDDEDSEDEGEEAASADDEDDDGEFGGDDDEDEVFDVDDDDEESGGGKELLIIIAAASVVGLAAICGGAWWYLGGDGSGEPGAASSAEPGVPVVSLAVPPKTRKLGGGMSPPSGGRAGAGSLNAISVNEKGPGAGIVVPSVTVAAFATLSPVAPDKPLSENPAPELVEQSNQGPLPKVSSDGRMSWQVYARPSDPGDGRPRVAIIFGGLGLSRAATEAAINRLPGAVTLAFDPYAEGLEDWVVVARKVGHEVLMGLPMEPEDFPQRDPGPYP